ncbi:MAG: 5'-methylthioadenosine/adenosylhomocysteine nucleosidase [Kiritimatiellia bacterium]
MTYAILGALNQEVALIKEQMSVTAQTEALGTVFFSGTLFGKSIVVACCGIGKVNAAACATYLLLHLKCDAIINIGIAGAIAHGLKTLDVVVSRELCFHDQDDVMLKYFPARRFFEGDATLLALCEKACAQPGVLRGKLHIGRIASGDQFGAARGMRDRIIATCFPDFLELEGAAIAHVAFATQKPCLIIRTMSDCADDDASVTYDNFLDCAATQSAHIILSMLSLA